MANDRIGITMLSPLAEYLDEQLSASGLAPRPASLDGRVVGLLPNWRPSAIHILKAVGALLAAQFDLKELVVEQPVRELPIKTGKLLDTLRDTLDSFASRVDVAITATGD